MRRQGHRALLNGNAAVGVGAALRPVLAAVTGTVRSTVVVVVVKVDAAGRLSVRLVRQKLLTVTQATVNGLKHEAVVNLVIDRFTKRRIHRKEKARPLANKKYFFWLIIR